MNRLLKKEIGTINIKVLNMHYCRILERGETMAAKDIPVADAKQILWIEDELRWRAIKAVGHDFYPPDRIEKKYPSNYMISLIKPTKPKSKPSMGRKIKFPVTVTSSIGTKVATFTVKADTKDEADLLAHKQIRELGLKGVSYKLS